MIGYLSFDASVKVHYSGKFTSTKTDKTGYGGIQGYIRHIDRGTDKKNGCEVNHSNPDINPDFTLLNESYYKDENGWHRTTSSKDMVVSIEKRIQYAIEHKARISTQANDTVIVRPLVVQLSDVTGHEDTWKWDVIEILEEQFGKENIRGFSVHKDETNVHMHVAFVPVYETEKNGKTKCSISQTKFFKSPQSLSQIHRTMRKKLSLNYDIEVENKPIEEQIFTYTDGYNRKKVLPLTPDQLKVLSERQIKLELEGIDMALRKSELDKLKKAMDMVAENAKAEKEELEKERIAVENDKATVAVQLQTLIEEKAKLERMREEVYSTAEICSKILSEEKNLNAKFMEFLDRESKRTGKKIHQTVENLYKRFQNERKKNVSNWQLEMLRLRNERLKDGNNTTDNSMDIIDITDTGYDFSA